jgi:hypothetical protein
MNETVLRERLLATVPALDDADWLDVRRRARAIEAPRRRNRRLLAIAAALAVLTALVVNPALGIGERLLEFVEGDPAPESVKEELRRQADHPPLRVGHRVIERPKPPPPDLVDARLAVALDSSVGPVYLWIAPTSGGGACTALEITALPPLPDGRPNTSGGCSSGPTVERRIDGGQGEARVGKRGLSYILGRVHPSIVRLKVALSDERVVPVRLVEGFFLAELPAKATVVEYRGFDASGSLVERLRVPERVRVPPSTEGWRIRPIEPFRKAASIRLYSGRDARIEHARAEGGLLCWRNRWGEQMSTTCGPVPEDALPSMMVSGTGKNQTVLLSGPVGSRVERVDLIWDNGDRERLAIQNGFVLKQIDPYGARFPSKLVGRDRTGRVVADRAAFGPG